MGKRVVRQKVEVSFSVRGLPVDTCNDATIHFMAQQDVKKGQLSIRLHLHCELDALFNPIDVLQEVVHSVNWQRSTGVIDISLPEWKFGVKGGHGPVLNILHD